MNLEEKYKKEKSDMDFEEKCRREAADDVKSEDTSLDEDFEDQYYDDEFSDQYMELGQLSFIKGEHEQQNQIQEILNKYSTVISTSQDQDETKSPLEGANLSLPSNQKNASSNKKNFVEKPSNLLQKMKVYSEMGTPYQQDVQFKKLDEPKISEQALLPFGKTQGQDSLSLEMNPKKSKSKELSCDVCNKKLASSYNLKIHKPFSCNHCEEAFVRKLQLVSHMTRVHGIN